MINVNNNRDRSFYSIDQSSPGQHVDEDTVFDSETELQAYFDDLLIPIERTGHVKNGNPPQVTTPEDRLKTKKSFVSSPFVPDLKKSRHLVNKHAQPEYSEEHDSSHKKMIARLDRIKNTLESDPVRKPEKDSDQECNSKPLTLKGEKKEELQLLLSKSVGLSQTKAEQTTQQGNVLPDQIKEETNSDIHPMVNTSVSNSTSTGFSINPKLEGFVEEEPYERVDTSTDSSAECCYLDQMAWCENGRPAWAQEKFQVLLFEVSGLKLAVPLVALGQIVRLNEKLTPIFGQSDWFMGLLPGPLGQLKIVNTALFVMPERYNNDFLSQARFAISLNGEPWALAVDSVNQPIEIHPDDVKWRGQRTSRPWLGGTVKAHMCALIDIPNMAEQLNVSD